MSKTHTSNYICIVGFLLPRINENTVFCQLYCKHIYTFNKQKKNILLYSEYLNASNKQKSTVYN